MNNNTTIFMEAQKLAKEGKIAYTGRTVVYNVNGMDIEYKETEAIHTFLEWKNAGYMVKKGEKAIAKIVIWNYTDKASKAKREALEKAGDDPDKKIPHFYTKESAFFSQSQVKKLDDPAKNVKTVKIDPVKVDPVTIPEAIPVKKSDLAILKRILKDGEAYGGGHNLLGRLIRDDGEYIMSQHYGVFDAENKYDDLAASDSTFDTKTCFKTTAEAAKDGYKITFDLEALKAAKKENTGRKSYDKKPYLVKIIDGNKTEYAGFNPSFLIDVLTFTRTESVMIAKEGFNKAGNLTSPAYIDNGTRKALLLPVNVNPNKRPDIDNDVKLTVTI